MKKNKFISGVIACAFAAIAMTGCSLTLGGSDRASDASVENDVTEKVAKAKEEAIANGEIEEEEEDDVISAGWTGTIDASGWWVWNTSLDDIKVESGKTVETKVTCTFGIKLWNGPILVVRSAPHAAGTGDTPSGAKEYIVARPDWYAWGTEYGADDRESKGIVTTSSYPALADVNNAECKLYVTNNGDGTLECGYVWENHYTKFASVPCDGDVYFGVCGDTCSITFCED